MPGPLIRLRSLTPELKGRVWESAHLLRVGRLIEYEIVLDNDSVSRQHAEVAFSEQGWVARDLGSRNGTFLNGARIGRAGGTVRKGDILQCGEITMVVDTLRETGSSSFPSAEGQLHVQCAIEHSWEHIPAVVASGPALSASAKNPLLTLVRTGRDFHGANGLEAFLQSILWEAAEALDAQGASVLLRNETTGQLVCRADFGGEVRTGQPAGADIRLADRALREGKSLLCSSHPLEELPIADCRLHSISNRQSAIYALLRSPRKQLGVLYLARGGDQQPFDENDLGLADALALSVSPTIDSIEHLLGKEREFFLLTLTALAQMIDLRDDSTGSHTQRVTDYALWLAEELNLPDTDRHLLRIGTPLHDLGKIGIADATLLKASPLSPEEGQYMKSHVVKGFTLLESIPGLAPLLPIVRSHHERWDGTGYPDGLCGEQIPLLGRIVAVADAFDAMTTDRPYRLALPLDEAFAELQRKAGDQFDPNCVRAFLRLRPRIEALFSQRQILSNTLTWQKMNETREMPDMGALPGKGQKAEVKSQKSAYSY